MAQSLVTIAIDNTEYQFRANEWDAILRGDGDAPTAVFRYLIKLQAGELAKLKADHAAAEAALLAERPAPVAEDPDDAVARAIKLPKAPRAKNVSPPANTAETFAEGKAHDESLPFPGNTTFDRDIRDGFVDPDGIVRP